MRRFLMEEQRISFSTRLFMWFPGFILGDVPSTGRTEQNMEEVSKMFIEDRLSTVSEMTEREADLREVCASVSHRREEAAAAIFWPLETWLWFPTLLTRLTWPIEMSSCFG